MTKLEMLFIRACKSDNADRRIDRLYKMFYCSEEGDFNIVRILLRIAEKYAQDMRLDLMLSDLAPENGWRFGCDDTTPYYTKVRRMLINRIRFTQIGVMPELILPAKWRK